MAPLSRPIASRSSSQSSTRVDSTDESQTQQANRTSANLNAYRSAQALTTAQRPAPPHRHHVRRPSRPSSTAGIRTSVQSIPEGAPAPSSVLSSPTSTRFNRSNDDDGAEQRHADSDVAGGVKRSTTNDTIGSDQTSTTNDTAGSSSGGDQKSRTDSNASQGNPTGPPGSHQKSRTESDSTAGSPAGPSRPAQHPIHLPPVNTRRQTPPWSAGTGASTASRPPPRRPDMSQRSSLLLNSSRLEPTPPRTVRDLGSDYTRYFNPFASRNASMQDLSTATPLLRYDDSRNGSSAHLLQPSAQGVSGDDLAKRLSNPFRDERRLSDPFASGTNTPATAVSRVDLNEKKPATAMSKVDSNEKKPMTTAMLRTDISNADPEKLAFLVMDDRLGNTEYALPLYTDQPEDDDDMHMPQWDDDIRLKPKLKDHFTRENLVSTFGMAFMILGLLCVFVVLPAISWSGVNLLTNQHETPLDQMYGAFRLSQPWAHVNDVKYPLMQNIKMTLIDPDTPDDVKTITANNGDKMNLVFSDEFNKNNRTFYPGDDPFWFAFEGWYGATQDLEYYDPDAVNTGDGTLLLQMDAFLSHNLDYRSGMLNSWNQLCFKGGHFEVSMSLPGPAGVHGLWPGAWTLGNLGRPGYLATTDGVWPYTYNDCDAGITPNQSMTDGLSNLPGQRLSSCTCAGEDHPTPGTGRGAPEIDIAEVSADWGGLGIGVATQSYQVAPFDVWWYPNYDYMETPNYNLSFVNTWTGGPYQQAVSTTSMLNNDWYDGKSFQKYAFEYQPGSDSDAYITWLIGDDEMMSFDGRAVGPNGNVGQRIISEEPMTIVMNLGISHNWVDIKFQELFFPTVMRFDYVRWYQKEGEEMVTCDPPGFETTEYIRNHPEPYNNINLTQWRDAGYEWPKNTLMDGCKA